MIDYISHSAFANPQTTCSSLSHSAVDYTSKRGTRIAEQQIFYSIREKVWAVPFSHRTSCGCIAFWSTEAFFVAGMFNWLIVVDHWCMMEILRKILLFFDFEEFSTKPECKLDSAVSSCVYLHNYSRLSPQLCVIIIVSHRQPIPCPSLPAVLLLPAMNVYIHACIGSLQPAPLLHLTMPKPWAQNRIQPHFMPHEAINLH